MAALLAEIPYRIVRRAPGNRLDGRAEVCPAPIGQRELEARAWEIVLAAVQLPRTVISGADPIVQEAGIYRAALAELIV
jgi:hypothetical protein